METSDLILAKEFVNKYIKEQELFPMCIVAECFPGLCNKNIYNDYISLPEGVKEAVKNLTGLNEEIDSEHKNSMYSYCIQKLLNKIILREKCTYAEAEELKNESKFFYTMVAQYANNSIPEYTKEMVHQIVWPFMLERARTNSMSEDNKKLEQVDIFSLLKARYEDQICVSEDDEHTANQYLVYAKMLYADAFIEEDKFYSIDIDGNGERLLGEYFFEMIYNLYFFLR